MFVFFQSCFQREALREITLIYWAYPAAAKPSGCSRRAELHARGVDSAWLNWTVSRFPTMTGDMALHNQNVLSDATVGVCRVTMLLWLAEEWEDTRPELDHMHTRRPHFCGWTPGYQTHLLWATHSPWSCRLSEAQRSHWLSVEWVSLSGASDSIDSLATDFLWSHCGATNSLELQTPSEATDSLWNYWLSPDTSLCVTP